MLEHDKNNKVALDKQADIPEVPVVESSRLFGRSREILIRHGGAIYRLRITKNEKLIMNK